MPCDLTHKKCKPCEGGVDPLKKEVAKDLLKQTIGWTISEDGKSISQRFEFKGFYKVMGFINALAWIANTEGHHPDVKYGYNYCEVLFTTHAIDGLSENDFICASKIDALLNQ
ncbi:MAG: 4a-hydroxytetrahydrobiopterin dehydratase [Gammaproteobacteria bacterium RIFCSPHIGHO2_12_FULL_41_15]|nr:MAG: 4a-hydroxytetrahydrobiopterin dehydratase [Gammaproteobacteria bacterium RIFCSPHIGHO2_12_FULL_41_15]